MDVTIDARLMHPRGWEHTLKNLDAEHTGLKANIERHEQAAQCRPLVPVHACVCTCVCVRTCMRARVSLLACLCVRACACACVSVRVRGEGLLRIRFEYR